MTRLAWLGCALVGVTAAGVLLQMSLLGTWPDNRNMFAASMLIAVAVYFAAARVSLAGPLPPRALHLVLGTALALRLLVLFAPPLLSGDVFRYVWDGRVQAAGINPYEHVPADPALAFLRDAEIYPNINRADYAPTIYPPAAQVIFAAVGRVASSVLAVKTAMVGFEILAVLCLLRLLAIARLPPERVLIYAWNPLAVWEFAGSGHVDAAAIGLLGAALLLRVLRRDSLAGLVLGAAVLVKFLPLAAAPAFWRARAGWRTAAGCVLAMAGLYGLYIGAGAKVLGFLPGYRAEEGQVDGSGLWLLAGLRRLSELPQAAPTMYFAVAGAALLALAAWVAFRPRPPAGSPADAIRVCGDAALLVAALTFVISPHYPWYYVWLALPAVVAPYWSVIWLSAAPALLYLSYLDYLDYAFTRPALFFVPALLLLLADLRRGGRAPPVSISEAVEGRP
jgi:alpha-1,6-mannosyltransferase